MQMSPLNPAWSYKCENNVCVKIQLTDPEHAISLPVCRLFCTGEIGTLWPKPTGPVKVQEKLAKVAPSTITFKPQGFRGEASTYFDASKSRFMKQLEEKVIKGVKLSEDGIRVVINLHVNSPDTDLTYEIDEGYKLRIQQDGDNKLNVTITAENYYGARNGLETLVQLIVFDDIRNQLFIVADIELEDTPVYKHRGVILDTSRSYFSVESIKRTIDALALVKMNTFHWHITDSHSFPVIFKSVPELAQLGAYSPQQVYTESDVKDIVQYARIRGVRVIPEFDAPAHVGEGWQNTGLTACFNAQPWQKYCVEPPCGQLDPTKEKLYDVLEKIYSDFVDYFSPVDTIFHMGGDEVSTDCWNSSTDITNYMKAQGWGLEKSDFMKLWGDFQENALERWDRVAKTHVPIILWTSHLTEMPYLEKYLNNERYIIQIWTKGDDPKVQTLLESGFKLIISNYDALYLDCGFAGWVTDGNNWCSPYIGWQKVYANDLKDIGGSYSSQILGAEAALWSEQADEYTLDGRLWPRVSALAERLWSDPKTSWRDAESRLLVHREQLVQHGVQPELLQPQWCLQNEDQCPLVQRNMV
uniref:Beta-hexosaminidase n=1 Tax=Culicoides sonorensis TaxID=179676 RepID=A0A336MGX8_CULSO